MKDGIKLRSAGSAVLPISRQGCAMFKSEIEGTTIETDNIKGSQATSGSEIHDMKQDFSIICTPRK